MKKRLLAIVVSLLLMLTTGACTQQPADGDKTTKATDAIDVTTQATASAAAVEPATEPSASAVTTTAAIPTGGNGASSTVTVVVTASQARVTQAGSANERLPWITPVEVPFVVEELCAGGQAFELFFSTANLEFYRSYMTDTCFVLENGKRIKQDALQAAVNDGTITPSQLMAVYNLYVRTKQATDTASGEECFGNLYSFQSYREARAVQGNTVTYLYLPYDFIGEFYRTATSSAPTGYDGESVGYYLNAAQLTALAEAACPQRSFAALSKAEGIRVGDTLYVSQKTAEQAGIGVRVVVGAEAGQITGLELTLP